MFLAFLLIGMRRQEGRGGSMGSSADKPVSWRRRVRRRGEDILFALALSLIPCLPRRCVVRLADFLGAAAWMLDRRDRRIAMANLELAYGEALTVAGRRAIVRGVFRNFALTALDLFWFARDTGERIRRHVVVEEGSEVWLGAGPLVAVTAHFGNWEIFGHVAALRGATLVSVAKPVKNPAIDGRLNRLRQASGQRIVPREGALKALVRALHDKGSVAFLLDQDTRESEGGVFVDFFGVPAPVSGAAAGLAVRMGVPLVLGYCRHEGGGRYRCYVRDVLPPDALRGREGAAVTAEIARRLEAEIRRYPEQWLWTYKRWKRRQPGSDPARYPFYADA